jgi:hypothetical protein
MSRNQKRCEVMKIAVSELIVKYMESLGIEYSFGRPGAHILPVYGSLYRSGVRSRASTVLSWGCLLNDAAIAGVIADAVRSYGCFDWCRSGLHPRISADPEMPHK